MFFHKEIIFLIHFQADEMVFAIKNKNNDTNERARERERERKRRE